MIRRLFVLMVGLALLGGFTVAEARTLVLRVATDVSTFDFTASGPVGGAAFYIGGVICADPTLFAACVPIGTFHCWGWLIGPDQLAAVVSQEYDLDGRGKIQVQGVEDEGPRAVTGVLVTSATYAVRPPDSIYPTSSSAVSSPRRSSSKGQKDRATQPFKR